MTDSTDTTVIRLKRPQAWAIRLDIARQEFLIAWRNAATHMSQPLAEAEAAATYSAMVDAAKEITRG